MPLSTEERHQFRRALKASSISIVLTSKEIHMLDQVFDALDAAERWKKEADLTEGIARFVSERDTYRAEAIRLRETLTDVVVSGETPMPSHIRFYIQDVLSSTSATAKEVSRVRAMERVVEAVSNPEEDLTWGQMEKIRKARADYEQAVKG
jgi:predicted RNA-binding Zn ribbon-like protein